MLEQEPNQLMGATKKVEFRYVPNRCRYVPDRWRTWADAMDISYQCLRRVHRIMTDGLAPTENLDLSSLGAIRVHVRVVSGG